MCILLYLFMFAFQWVTYPSLLFPDPIKGVWVRIKSGTQPAFYNENHRLPMRFRIVIGSYTFHYRTFDVDTLFGPFYLLTMYNISCIHVQLVMPSNILHIICGFLNAIWLYLNLKEFFMDQIKSKLRAYDCKTFLFNLFCNQIIQSIKLKFFL